MLTLEGLFGVLVMFNAINVMVPKPSPYSLRRIGGDSDGAYLVPDDLDGVQACFSPGVFNFKDFEDELASRYGIRSYMCDFSSDIEKFATPMISGMQVFDKKWLDVSGDLNSFTLDEWVSLYEPDASSDLILQMDIEGAEYKNLLHASRQTLNRFRIIVVEMHGLHAFTNRREAEQGLIPTLTKLNSTHVCVHAHPNNCCGDFFYKGAGMKIPHVIELTFLRKDRFCRKGARLIEPSLPHPRDIKQNVDCFPPLYLDKNWSYKKVAWMRRLLFWISYGFFLKVKSLVLRFKVAARNIAS